MEIESGFNKLKCELANHFKGYDVITYDKSLATAYLVLSLKEKGVQGILDKSMRELCSVIEDADVYNFVYEMMSGVEQEFILSLFSYDIADLRSFVLNEEYGIYEKGEEQTTPESIIKLALDLLKIQPNETVLDNCSGTGSFITNAYYTQRDAKFYGVEINPTAAAIAKMRVSLLNGSFNLLVGNALEHNFDGQRFDKAFSNYPFGIRLRLSDVGYEIFDKLQKSMPELVKATSSDWAFNYSLCEMLAPNGTAVAVTSLGGLWNTIDKPIRELFIKKRLIKAIIKLPARLFSTTSIPVAMIVFGESNGAIRMIDASKEYKEGRRQNILHGDNILNILYAMEYDVDYAKTVSFEEIASNQFNFDPTRYIEDLVEIENGVEFGSIINHITRGAPASAKDLDEMTSAVPTDFQYVTLANIRNGVIDKDLPYLKGIPDRFGKYCINSGDILLSKNGYPFKVAVVESTNEKYIVANGNLYIIQLDTKKVNPYYVKAFLESEKGIAQLKRISVGSTIPNIGVSQLNTIKIPMIPREEQDEIANRCLAIMDEIEFMRRKIERCENELKTIISE